MSRKWLVAALLCFVIATALAVVGYFIPRLLPFTEALLASSFGIFVALGIAILVIEGTSLTQLGRRSMIINRTARAILSDTDYAIFWDTLALGRWLGSVLPEQIPVDEESHVLSCKVKETTRESTIYPVLRKVFQQAQQVRATDIKSVDSISSDDYKRTVFETMEFVKDFSRRIESNLDVHERLLELSEALEKLKWVSTRCLYHVDIRQEENRFRGLGKLGIASVDFCESLNGLHRRFRIVALPLSQTSGSTKNLP